MVGVKDPGAIAIASVRNDLAFLVTVVGSSSLLAVLAAAFLPGAPLYLLQSYDLSSPWLLTAPGVPVRKSYKWSKTCYY